MTEKNKDTIRKFIEFLEQRGYVIPQNYINDFLSDKEPMPKEISELYRKASETEMWFPECFYFAIKSITHGLSNDKEYPAFILLTKWEWYNKFPDEAQSDVGYFRIKDMFNAYDKKLAENQFDETDGIFWVKNMTEDEIRKSLTDMRMEEKSEILQLFPYVK